MINNADDKACAFIRRIWWETARQHLSDSERLCLYETILARQFGGDMPGPLPPMVAMLFDLIRPVLDADRAKMDRRAEVARRNGALGGRPEINKSFQEVTKPSGLNENPVGFFGLANTMSNTNTNTKRQNVCVPRTEIDNAGNGQEEEDTHTKFLVCLEFYLAGVTDPVEEGKLFWAYYEARGWKTSNGQPIANVLALAKAWHPKTLNNTLAKRRLGLRSFFEGLEMPAFSLFERISAVEIDNPTQTVYLFVKTKMDAVFLETNLIDFLSRWVKAMDKRTQDWRLEYRFSAADDGDN